MTKLKNLQPFYYPGSKWSKVEAILLHLITGITPNIAEFREPFFGSGAVGITLLARLPRRIDYWFGDSDPALCCLWFAMQEYPDELIEAILAYEPVPADFPAIKTRIANYYRIPDPPAAAEIVEIAVAKLIFQQCSFHGYGAGLRGGRDQVKPERNHMSARWHPATIAAKIRALSGHFRLGQVRFSQRECWHLIDDQTRRAFLYLDPPYLYATAALYMRRFTLADHERLADALRRSPHAFALSHRHNTTIRDLYAGWAEVHEVDAADLLITRL